MKIAGLQKSVCHWRNCYNYLSDIELMEKGLTMIECANDIVEYIIQSECCFMKISGCRSDKACKQFRTTAVSLMWENDSMFYEFMCPLFVGHVKIICMKVFSIQQPRSL